MTKLTHYGADAHKVGAVYGSHEDTRLTYTFENFFHPYLAELIQRLNRGSIAELLAPEFLEKLVDSEFFNKAYKAHADAVTGIEFYEKDIDVSIGGPYANYNWELLFHIPFTIAVHLSKNQRFAEAQKWFHLVFDPTNTDTSVAPPLRYWKFLRFRQGGIDNVVALLGTPDAELTPAQLVEKKQLFDAYSALLDTPFSPHAIARTRPIAYQYAVVMKYLDNLIAWGDSLFLQDTIEAINEAQLRYVLAANILGERPQRLPEAGKAKPRNFSQLAAAKLDALGDALVDLETQFPFDGALPPAGDGDSAGALFGIGRTLYFCIPNNTKLLGYWDTVADRLFKIRHCMNISGAVRQLALFDPPLDPGMLVKAAAAGMDIASIVSGLAQPVSQVRGRVLLGKAIELVGEVKAMGAALLAALEKGDAEHLARLRQGHELAIAQLTQSVRFTQWKQAEAATEALLRSRATTLERYRFYQRVLGATPDAARAPDSFAIDRGMLLTEENFDDVHQALVGQFDLAVRQQPYVKLELAQSVSPSTQSGATGSGNLYLNKQEDAELNDHMPTARDRRRAASDAEVIASVLDAIPEFFVNMHYWGIGGSSKVSSGLQLADAVKVAAEVLRTEATWESDQAGLAGRVASHQRRADDWTLQYNLAARELVALGRQIITSLLAEQVARHDYETAKQTVANAQEVSDFLQGKFTAEELYQWQQGELSRLYYEYYRLAFDTARKTEATVKHELMRPELDATDFVAFNYWDGGRKGLLSGEALLLDLKRLEHAYLDANQRELELTKHVSLRQLDPFALLTLRTTGTCQVELPEWLFDRDCPGHYMRRIKSVALSLPSVVGPYTNLCCTLTLLKSSVRRSSLLLDGKYERAPSGETRFVDYVGAAQSVVTSSGQNDSGLFDTSLGDERFLPFEGAGALSTWQLALPPELRAFDYSTISDAILHVRYTARDGGAALAKPATDAVKASFGAGGAALLFALRTDLPTEWAAFVAIGSTFTFRLRKDHFPYQVQGKALSIDALDLYASVGGTLARRTPAFAVPATAAADLAAHGYVDLAIPADSAVLKPTLPWVFLIVRYSF